MKKIVMSIIISSLVMSLLHSRRHAFRRRSSQTQNVQATQDIPIVKFRRNLAKKMNRPRGRKVFTKKSSLKKSIVIFSSTGGGGHGSVSYGLTRYLGNRYDITVLNALQTVLAPMDTLGTLTFGKVCGEDLYNFFLRCGWTNLLKSYVENGAKLISWRHDMLVKLMLDYFSQAKPDLIISVIPIFNGVFLEACEKLDIPLLIPTNDLDTTNYIVGLKPPYFKKFIYTLPFDDPDIWKKIEPAQIPKDQVVISGFPLRPEFFTPKNVPKLKRKFKIPP